GDQRFRILGEGGLPDTEPPVIRRQVLAQVVEGPAKAQRLVEGFLDQRAARGAFHHLGGHVQRGEDAVLRRSGDMHHEGSVEAIARSEERRGGKECGARWWRNDKSERYAHT